MVVLDKKALLLYKDSLLIAFTPKFRPSYMWGNLQGVLADIYTCIMRRNYSGTAQEKVDIAIMARNELDAIFKDIGNKQ